MPTPSEVLWDRELHTAAKHKVYETYFNAWFPILLQSRYARGGITYAEGFAGPGEYADRSPGSPLIALRSALQCAAPPTPRRPVNFLLAERDGNRLYHLRGLLESELGSLDPTYLRSRGLTVDAREGDCETVLPRLLSEHQAWHKPMLVILDTWGAAVSFSLLRRIAGSKSAEAIVTIQPQHFVRFATDPEHFGDNIFGPVLWRDVQHQATPHKAEYIRSQYRRTLNEAAFRYVLDFQLADEKSNLLYLVYGTNHRLGVEKMKEAMWTVDPYHGIGYRDPRDPNQQTLAIEPTPQTTALRRLIAEHVARLPDQRATVEALRDFTLFETVYKPSQTTQALQRLLSDGVLRRQQPAGRLEPKSVIALNEQQVLPLDA